jgi:hypothetical protein
MTLDQVSSYLFFWGLLGCGFFALLIVVLFRTRLVYAARKEDGTLKDQIPLRGKLTMLIVPVSYIIFQLFANYFSLIKNGFTLNFGKIFFLNYGIYLILFLFDTLVIDGFVISIWRPTFLKIPDAMGKESMKKHIRLSIPVGLLIGAVLTLISTTISAILWIQ